MRHRRLRRSGRPRLQPGRRRPDGIAGTFAAEELDRLQHGVDVPPLAVTADITSELAAELQAPFAVVADVADRQILIHPCRSHADPPPVPASRLTAPRSGA